jgi:hypothetical protein
MDEITIELDLIGVCAKDWPMVRVLFNDCVLYHNKIVGQQFLKFAVTPQQFNLLQIQHIDKQSDTLVDDSGAILSDRHCLVNILNVNGILMDIDFFSSNSIYYLTNDNENIITNYLGKEGSLNVKFPYPMWKFWHQQQIKTDLANL